MDHSLDQEIVLDSSQSERPLADSPVASLNASSSLESPTGSNVSRHADGQDRIYWIWVVCGFLVLAVGLVFGQTVRHEFLGFDDNRYVYQNPHVTPGLTLSGLWWALTDGPTGDWYPLAALSHMLDCQLYGLNPAGHFLTNVLLHAASSVLLFLVLLRMTGDFWPSAWVAAIFAIHPLHVESVAWIAERRDMLSGLFFMLTLLTYALYAERPSLGRYLSVAGCFALGLMSKPMLITVPFLLLLLDYWPLDRFRPAPPIGPQSASRSWLGRLSVGWRLLVEKLPLIGLAGLRCWIVLSIRFVVRVDRRCRPIAAGDTPGKRRGFIRSLLRPVFLSRRFGSPLSSSGPTCRLPGSPVRWFCFWRSPRWPRMAGAGDPTCWSVGCGF